MNLSSLYNPIHGTITSWPHEQIEKSPYAASDILCDEIQRLRNKADEAIEQGDKVTAEAYDKCKKAIQDILWNLNG